MSPMLALFKTLTTLMPAIAIVNLFGGIVGGVWAAATGDWWAIGYAILGLTASTFAIGLLLMPAIALGAIGAGAIEKQAIPAGRALFALGSLYTAVLMAAWAFFVSRAFLGHDRQASLVPILLLAYGSSTAPWAYMASKDQQAGGNEFSLTSVAFLQAGYVLGGVLYLLKPENGELLLWPILIALALNWLVQQVLLREIVVDAAGSRPA